MMAKEPHSLQKPDTIFSHNQHCHHNPNSIEIIMSSFRKPHTALALIAGLFISTISLPAFASDDDDSFNADISDSHGNRVGSIEKNSFGNYDQYDSHGRQTGSIEKDFDGHYSEYDDHGKQTGSIEEDFDGHYTRYDSHGNRSGTIESDGNGHYSIYDNHGNYLGSADKN